MTIRRTVVALALLALSSGARAGVLVVDWTGQGDFSKIADAVAAAGDGDTVLVRSGAYQAFTIDGEGVRVVADTGAVVIVDGSITVRNIPSGSMALLDRLHATGISKWFAPDVGYGLRIVDCAGAVRVQGGTYRGASGVWVLGGEQPIKHPTGYAGIRIEDSPDVALSLLQLNGGDGFDMSGTIGSFGQGPGGPGCYLDGNASRVSIHDCTALGGRGGAAWQQGSPGGAGLETHGGQVFISNVAATGGDGGGGANPHTPAFGGDGGFGLFQSGNTVLLLLDSTLAGGFSGMALGSIPVQAPALGPAQFGGTPTPVPGFAKGFGIPKALREGTAASMLLAGQPGDLPLLLVAPAPAFLGSPLWKGILLVDPGALAAPVPLGAIPAGGTLSVPFALPLLPAGLDAVGVHLQALFLGAAPRPTLASPSHLTILSAQF